MSDPIAAIVQDAAAPAAPPTIARSLFSKLMEPSPRTMEQLSADEFSQGINEVADMRLGGLAVASHLGEAVMDCAYALMPGGLGGGASPLARLAKAIMSILWKLRSLGRGPKPAESYIDSTAGAGV